MDPEAFRRWGYAAIDRIAAYLAEPEAVRVLPDVQPGDVRAALPSSPPEAGEPFEALLADFDEIIVPATTHWNHPGFMAYFAVTGSAPGILAELLASALNVNAMVWRTGPAATELEALSLDWLRQLVGLPATFDGVINDSASTSTLYALAAAREATPGLDIRARGMAGRTDLPPLCVYCSQEAHSSVDKAALTLGFGMDGIRRIRTDDRFRLDVGELEAAIREDLAAGRRPVAVVATTGTTSTTAVDPVPAIADLCEEHGIWLHVDAAYGGAAAVLPEMRWVLEGAERADSIVINPHKWLFVPIDCSALYCRRPEVLRRAFSLVPPYLATPESDRARNLMDYGVALGRRFRALKLWFVLRYFGGEGIRDRLREHVRLARMLAESVDEAPDFERVAPTDFSVVVFRYAPAGREAGDLDAINAAILERVNASGEVFLSHTVVRGSYALRVAVGNLRTREAHVLRAWRLILDAAAALG
jgi:aromatic-L-amino-acid decarboxylase